MKWLRDIKSKFVGEPFAGFPPMEILVPMPAVKPPAPEGQSREELLSVIHLLEQELEQAGADNIQLRKQLGLLDGRIQKLLDDWPKIHAQYFTRRGLEQLNSPTRKRK